MLTIRDLDFISFVGIPLFIALLTIFIIKKLPLKNIFLYSIFYFYIILLLSIVFFPIFIVDGIRNTDFINLVPFSHLYEKSGEIFKNIVLLLPAGFFIPFIFGKIKNYKNAVLVGILISFFIESIQIFIKIFIGDNHKVFDVDDIILNAFGFILGFFIFKNFDKIKSFYKDISEF